MVNLIILILDKPKFIETFKQSNIVYTILNWPEVKKKKNYESIIPNSGVNYYVRNVNKKYSHIIWVIIYSRI